MLKQANLSFSVAAQSFGDDVTAIQFSTLDRNTAKLAFTIKNGKQPLNLTDVEAKVDLVMGDKSVFDDNVARVTSPEEGKIEYTITPEQIRHPGRARGELQLTSKDGQSIGGFRFNFTVKKALVDEVVGPVKEYYVQDLEAIKAEIRKTADSIKDLDVVQIDTKLNELEEQIGEGVGVDEQARQGIQDVTAQLADTVKEVNGVKPTNGKVTLPIPQVDTTNLRTKTEKLKLEDMSPEALAAIEGGEGTSFNLLSIPQDNSVTTKKMVPGLRKSLAFMTNLITNGDFSNGVSGWSPRSPSTLSVNEGVGIVSASTTVASAGIQQDIAISTESKVYFRIRIKVVKTVPFYIHASSPVSVGSLVANEWLDFSMVQPMSSPTVRFYQALNAGESFSIDNILAINLTDIYGSGNEPTQSEMDSLIASMIPNNWFDGDFTLSQRQLYNMINQNTGLGNILTKDGEKWEVL